MRRRDFLLAPVALPTVLGQTATSGGQSQTGQSSSQYKAPREWVTAAASRDTAPRVGLIPSTFAGTEEMDGRKIPALRKPTPMTESLTSAQLHDMLRLATELGGGRRGGLATAVSREDWVVVKVSAQKCCTDPAFHAGTVTDPRLVSSVLRFLAESGLGKRFSVVEGAPWKPESERDSIWESNWNGSFEGLSYRSVVQDLSRRHPSLRFELLDLNSAPCLEMPVEGRMFASRNSTGMYKVPRVLRECDRVISIAPLSTRAGSGIGLSILNYLGFGPGNVYGEGKERLLALGAPGEVALDLFSFHPADYSIVGGTFAAESNNDSGETTRMRRHNVLIAGTNALAVDAVGAAVMGFDSTAIRHLELAAQRGYGSSDASSIWTRGAEIDEVKFDFRKPAMSESRRSGA